MTPEMAIPETSLKMSKRMKGIKIDGAENLRSGDVKWGDS